MLEANVVNNDSVVFWQEEWLTNLKIEEKCQKGGSKVLPL